MSPASPPPAGTGNAGPSADGPKADGPGPHGLKIHRPVASGLDILILHDPVPPEAPPDRQDTLTQARAMAGALARPGHMPRLAPFGPDLAAMRREFTARRPRLAVNLVESLAGLEHMAFAAPALLAALGIPCTGCTAAALLATASKSAVKRSLRRAGLPTPDWLPQDPLPTDARPGPGLYLLKPEHTHGSVGITDDAVVRAQSAGHLGELLATRARALGQPCLAEAYLPGREFSVSVLAGESGPRALPPAELRFLGSGPRQTRVLTYDAKWREDSPACVNSVRAFPQGEPELMARLADAALAVWRVFGLSGYARVDFRLDDSGAPQIIDVNANPCLAPDAGFAAAAARAGLDYEALAERIVQAALGWPERPATPPEPGGGFAWRTQVLPGDPEAVRRLTEATGFFNPEEIIVAGELVQEHLAKGEASGYFFLLAEDCSTHDGDTGNGGAQRGLAGYACFGPVPGTADSFDLYWIAVAPMRQGRGLGGLLLARAEALMAARGARNIYAETSSRGLYRPTRNFYEKNGYLPCARLTGFYRAGDDKIIYHKHAPGGRTETP